MTDLEPGIDVFASSEQEAMDGRKSPVMAKDELQDHSSLTGDVTTSNTKVDEPSVRDRVLDTGDR